MNLYPNQMTLRSLKGAPVSILISLHVTNTSLLNKELINWTGYSDKTIAQALDLLYGMGLVAHNGHRLGWSLTQKGGALFYPPKTITDGRRGTDTVVTHHNGSPNTAVSGSDDNDSRGNNGHDADDCGGDSYNDDDGGNAINASQRRISVTDSVAWDDGSLAWNAFDLDPAWVEGTPPHLALQANLSADLSRKKSDSLSSSKSLDSQSLDFRGKDQRRRQTNTAVLPQASNANTKVPNTAVSEQTTPPNAKVADTTVSQQLTTITVPTIKSPIVNRQSQIVNHHSPVTYTLLRQAGVGMTMSQFLSQLDWVTPAYVRAHLRQIKQNDEPINYAIHRMREGDAMPMCKCGRCDECHQRTVDHMGLAGVICR